MKEQKAYSPATQDITINWRKKHNYVPASEQPDIAAKQKYYRERQWLNESTEPQ
jgi:hypothetical protein